WICGGKVGESYPYDRSSCINKQGGLPKFSRRRKCRADLECMERSLLQRIFPSMRTQRALLAGTTILVSVALAGCNTASTLNPSETLTEGDGLDQDALDSVTVDASR